MIKIFVFPSLLWLVCITDDIIPTLYSSESWKLVNVVLAVIKYKY